MKFFSLSKKRKRTSTISNDSEVPTPSNESETPTRSNSSEISTASNSFEIPTTSNSVDASLAPISLALADNPKPIESEPKIQLPLTCLEAYEVLCNPKVHEAIAQLVHHFIQLIDVEKSELIDLGKMNETLDNNQFLKDLTDTAERLILSVENRTPYKNLFTDIMNLQRYLQVICLYYQTQVDQGQPIAKAYLAKEKKKNSSVLKTMSNISGREMNEDESDQLTKYTLNYGADDFMIQALPRLCDLILKSFLADHSSEKNFSYSEPRQTIGGMFNIKTSKGSGDMMSAPPLMMDLPQRVRSLN